jgi:hypothetical protein
VTAASTDLVPRADDDDGPSALADFLGRTTIYETAGAVIPFDLLRFGLLGSVAVIATGLLALVFPSAEAIRGGDFFLVLGDEAAGIAALLRALAGPAIVVGLGLLVLDLYLLRTPTSERWRTAVVAQAAAGGIGGALGTLFVALLVLNLAIWIALGILLLAMIAVMLGALGGS